MNDRLHQPSNQIMLFRHSKRDCHFDDPNNFYEESDNDDDLKQHYDQDKGSHEIEVSKNTIAASLMNISNQTTFILNDF